MEKKESISENIICSACLCVGRTIQVISDDKAKQYYLEVLNEIPLCNTTAVSPTVCWECDAILRRVVAFNEQVKDSYRILQTYTNENLTERLLTDVSRPPRLKAHTHPQINIFPEYEIELNIPNTSLESKGIKELQLVYVKDEIDIKNSDDIKDERSNSDPDNCPYESDYSDDLAKLETEIKAFVRKNDEEAGRSRRKEGKDKSRYKKAKKAVASTKRKKTQPKERKPTNNVTIRTIDLSYEEMLEERARDAVSDKYSKADYKCATCLIWFNYDKSYKDHVTSKHSADLGDYSCPICKTVIASVKSFTAHYKRHMRRYECTVCGKRSMDRRVMSQHYDSTHGGGAAAKEYKCNICNKISNSINTHRYHKDMHKKRVECSECDKTFSHRAGLLTHRLAVHKLNNVFPCTECEKVFRWKTSLKKHLEKHGRKGAGGAGAARAQCEPCGVSFTSVCSYQRHLRSSLKHVSQDELRFICAHCNRKFANKTKLRDHIEEKHLFKTYQCSICLKPSKNRVCLDQHMRNVHKGRPKNKICHHCGKGFPTKVQLESHIRSHTGEKPYICEYCPTTFSQQSNLYKHNRQVHMNIKAKRYPMCRKRKDKPEAAPENQDGGHPYQPRPIVLHYIHDREFL